mgnify:CR=1 FL=1
MNLVEIRPSPHIKGPKSVETIMFHVMSVCIILAAYFVFQYGLSALLSIVVIVASCLLTERFLIQTGTQSGSLKDYSACITGLLLALTLPPGFPLWMGAISGIAAIALGKGLFGGLGFNVFNPALVGRAFAQAAFPTAIATYSPSMLPNRFIECVPSTLAMPLMAPVPIQNWISQQQVDGISSATPLVLWKFESFLTSTVDLLSGVGHHVMASPSPILILLCGIYLAFRRFLDWRIPASVLASAAIFAAFLHWLDPAKFPPVLFTLCSGGLVLGAVLMATDMATSPVTPKGMWLYGALIGFLTIIIRHFSGLPEGVMYAILLGNAATPLIERISQPTPFGKGVLDKRQKGATYPLHPSYISREEDGAVAPKKIILKNKPKPEERRKPQRPGEKQ